MENRNLKTSENPTEINVEKNNKDLADQLQLALVDNEKDIKKLRRKLSITFWVIISLSIIMFAMGMLLLAVPIIAALGGQIDKLEALISAGFGIADLAGLFLFGPLEKIQKLMGDMSQLILALNSYQSQVGLRLMEMDVTNNRPSIGIAAERIGSASESSIKIIQEYFETSKESK
jgi:hypothetical protein